MITMIDPDAALKTAPEYTDALFASLVRSGDTDNKRGAYFERVFVYYAGIASEFATDVQEVLRFEPWASSPLSAWDGPKKDVGIDFVLTMKSPADKPVAVQTKFTTKTLGKSAIDALGVQALTQDRVDMFSRKIVVSNVDRENISSVLVGEAARVGISVLGREWFDEINQGLLDQGVIPPVTLDEVETRIPQPQHAALPPLALRPHQVKIHSHVMQTLQTTDRTTIHAACGSGKTLTAWSLFDSLVPRDAVAVVYTPALSLVDGIIRAFKRQQTADDRYDIRAVCSDKTVNAKDVDGADGNDMSPSQVHAQVMINADDIRAWLLSPTDGRRRVLVSTYQSSERVAQAVANTNIQFALQINDEAHQLAGAGTFGAHAWQVPSLKVVSLTATPRVTKLRSSGSENVTVTSMSDVDLFGKQADWATYPISEGIKDKVLAPYVIEILVTPHADDVNSETRVDDNDHDARMAAIAKVVGDIHRKENDGKGSSIVFFNLKSRSKKFESFVRKIDGSFPVHHLDGTTHVSVRLEAVADVIAKGGVLSNVNILNEGVDIPSLNAIIFADVRESKSGIVQSMGRVLRIDKNNPDKVGRIIIPVAAQSGVDAEDIVSNSDFSQVWEVIKAVCDYDDTFMHDMIEVRRQLARGESPRMPSSLRNTIRITTADGAELINAQWERAEFFDEFMSSVTTHAVRSIVSNWYEQYELVKAYHTTHGRLPSDRDQDEHGNRVGTWCTTQRQVKAGKKRGNLSQEQVNLLLALDLNFFAVNRKSKWYEQYELVKAYHTIRGRLPGARDQDEHGNKVGAWCSRQRKVKAGSKRGNLSQEQVNLLLSLDSNFFTSDKIGWDARYELVKAYHATHGCLPGFRDQDEHGNRIGQWCADQRQRVTGSKQGNLSQEQVDLLLALDPNFFMRRR